MKKKKSINEKVDTELFSDVLLLAMPKTDGWGGLAEGLWVIEVVVVEKCKRALQTSIFPVA